MQILIPTAQADSRNSQKIRFWHYIASPGQSWNFIVVMRVTIINSTDSHSNSQKNSDIINDNSNNGSSAVGNEGNNSRLR